MTRADLREEPLGDLGVDFASFNRAADHASARDGG
jgi:hypothetical protein